MSDPDSQVTVPESFTALFLVAGRLRRGVTASMVADRYELCEDLAQSLLPKARSIMLETSANEADVLRKIHQGMVSGTIDLHQEEIRWVIGRLNELLRDECRHLTDGSGDAFLELLGSAA